GALARAGADPEATAAAVARKGAGNFLYVTQAVEALRAGQIDPRRPDTFPEGLVGIYRALFERLFPGRQGYEAFRPLLEGLAAGRGRWPGAGLAGARDRDEFGVRADLERVAVVFPEREGRYQACHKSILDWLGGLAGRSRAYRLDVRDGHRRLALRLLRD